MILISLGNLFVLFLVYLTALSIAMIMHHQMIG
jgi:hypothetical protein